MFDFDLNCSFKISAVDIPNKNNSDYCCIILKSTIHLLVFFFVAQLAELFCGTVKSPLSAQFIVNYCANLQSHWDLQCYSMDSGYRPTQN